MKSPLEKCPEKVAQNNLNCNDKTGQGSRLLHEMIRSDPSLTAAELMEKMGCTLVEVRLARTEYEDF